MIAINDKNDCCGCWACYNACPKHCISMEVDDEGFHYPKVDKTACVDCGLCEKVCPVLNAELNDTPHEQKGYLVQHKNVNIRQESTSGGAFTAIAEYVIKKGGVVFGAGYRKDSFVVVHQPIEREEDLRIFRNSKYVQSEIGDCFRQVHAYLKQGRLVLFSGTPCQIEGLRGFLHHKNYDNLILVDLVCYGIPSPGIFKKYINWQKELIGGKFANVLFRDKYYGYNYSSFSIYNEESEKDYHKGVDTNAYLRAFVNNLSLRPSCFNCHFKKRYRYSDFTLWDCYITEKFTKTLDSKGTTSLLVQTGKANKAFYEITDMIKYVSVNPDNMVAEEKAMIQSAPVNPQREHFFADYKTMPAQDFFKKWFPITWKVRVNSFARLTCHKLGIYNIAKRMFLFFYKR